MKGETDFLVFAGLGLLWYLFTSKKAQAGAGPPPTSCPPGMFLVATTTPSVCVPGQEEVPYDAGLGAGGLPTLEDVQDALDLKNACPPGYSYDENGVCQPGPAQAAMLRGGIGIG